MYYILNETNQVIAADDNFLSYCGVSHIDELSTKIAKGDMGLQMSADETITLEIESTEKVFSAKKVVLSSMLGHLTLMQITEDNAEEIKSTLSSDLEDQPSELIDSIINEVDNADDMPLENISSENIEVDKAEDEQITFGDHLSLDEPLTADDTMGESLTINDISNDTSKETSIDTSSIDVLDDDALFDLVLDDDTEKSEKQTNDVVDALDVNDDAIDFSLLDDNDSALTLDEPQEEVSEILIDSEMISQKIGISNDDYKNFLNDFIDTALSLEKDLQSVEYDTRSDAVATLSHLSDVLHLSIITDILTNIKESDTPRKDIESLYSTLARITTQKSDTQDSTALAFELQNEDDVHTTVVDEKLELFDEPTPTPIIQESVTPRNAPKGDSFGSISLEDVKPKHFDFQLEEAANDLSLPVELIEEFVNDFIEQSHSETKKMLQAYENGDLDTIQKIGHLLKGASSNLRINPLSDTLYKIQFCEKSADLETLIKDYWAHFLSFETQINAISH